MGVMMATLTGSVYDAQPGMKLWKHFLSEPVLPLAASQDLPGGYAGKGSHRGPSLLLGSLEVLILGTFRPDIFLLQLLAMYNSKVGSPPTFIT